MTPCIFITSEREWDLIDMKSAHNLGRKKWVYELKVKYERNYVKYLEKRYGKERAVHFACQNT